MQDACLVYEALGLLPVVTKGSRRGMEKRREEGKSLRAQALSSIRIPDIS